MQSPRVKIRFFLLVADYNLKLFCLVNHLLEFRHCRHPVAKALCIIDFNKLRLKICSYTMAEFLDSINACGFEKFCELAGDAVDAHQVSVVGPLEDKFVVDACLLLLGSTALRASAFCKKIVSGLDACSLKLCSINFTYSLDLTYFVAHNWITFIVQFSNVSKISQ